MNASFRTAFWALCLGLTVPMVLFVGARLASGSKVRPDNPVAEKGAAKGLKNQLERNAGQGAGSGPSANGSGTGPDGSAASSGENSRADGTVTLNELEPDGAGQDVVLGPGLETDPAGRDRRVTTGQGDKSYPRPKIHAQPESVASVAVVPSNANLEAKLSGIQNEIDRIGRALEAQSQREAARDPVKQTADLLKQLHEANLLAPLASRDDSVAVPKPADEDPPPKLQATDTPVLPYDEQHESNRTSSENTPKVELVTRIFRPRFVAATALQSLIVPLLTPDLGRMGAAELGNEPLAVAGQPTVAAGTGAIVVCDVQEVMDRIELLLKKVDLPPDSVILEAVVVSVQLGPDRQNGLDLLEFNGSIQPFRMLAVDGGSITAGALASSTTAATDPLQLTRRYGLKRGVLNGDAQAFLSVVQMALTIRRMDAWQMTVANRQAANVMLTDPFGPGMSADRSAGTVLRVRPLVTASGAIHLDVNQDAALEFLDGTQCRTGALTHQFALQPGQTAVIGGFFADQAVVQTYSRTGLGDLPLFGGLFCKQVPGVERAETLVLLTPHLVSVDSNQQALRGKSPAIRAVAPTKGPKQGSILPAAGTQERKSPMKQRLKIK